MRILLFLLLILTAGMVGTRVLVGVLVLFGRRLGNRRRNERANGETGSQENSERHFALRRALIDLHVRTPRSCAAIGSSAQAPRTGSKVAIVWLQTAMWLLQTKPG
ncbi:MAG: hypothetical protein AB7L90_04205 [Hyphomicrobiaceae bacterium]